MTAKAGRAIALVAPPLAAPRVADCRPCWWRCPSLLTLALSPALRPSGFDADAEGPGHLFRLRPPLGVARRCRAGARPFRHHVRGRSVLRASRRRSRRAEGRDRRRAGRRADARRLDDHHADGQEPVSLAAARSVTLRKVIELPLAVYLDLVLPKRRIMEIYLNIAEWGPGIYGIEAAAQHHFGRSAKT